MTDEGGKGQGVPPSSSKASVEDSLSSRQASDPLREKDHWETLSLPHSVLAALPWTTAQLCGDFWHVSN